MEIIIGQRVKFINENLEGEIKSIISKEEVLVACNDGFDHKVMLSELIFITDNDEIVYQVDEGSIKDRIKTKINKEQPLEGILSKYQNLNKYKYEGVLEIDLHLEQLVEFPGKLDDWQRLHTQMQHVKKCLSAVFEKKSIRRVVFIHGVGTGVLKTELHNYLSDFNNLYIKEGDFREYGAGATEVVIKNS